MPEKRETVFRAAPKTHPYISLTSTTPAQKSHTREPVMNPLASHPISPNFQPPRHGAATASSTNLLTPWGTSQFSLTPSYATAPALSSPTFVGLPAAVVEAGTDQGGLGRGVSFAHLPDYICRLDSEIVAGAGEGEQQEAEERERKRANRKRQLTREEEARFESFGFEEQRVEPEPTMNRAKKSNNTFFRRTWAGLIGKLGRGNRNRAERKQNALIEAEERAGMMGDDEVAWHASGRP